jgi:RimJ/RimL family protein N-acetyltransferase
MSEAYLRKADYSDMELLYKWANDPETRANSFSPGPILFDDHQKWFGEKMNSANTLFFICHCENKNVGQVRLDIMHGIATINYSIDSVFRGKGYGSRMIVMVEKIICDDYPGIKKIQAEVKYGNEASQTIFRKLGYMEYRELNFIKFTKDVYNDVR